MPNTVQITVGNCIIGRISPALRGEGGPYNAQLVIRVAIALDPRLESSTLTVTTSRADLYLGLGDDNPATRFGVPVSADLTFKSLTRPTMVSEHIIDLRFPLTPEQVHLLEVRRHAQQDHQFLATLVLKVGVGWVVATWNKPVNLLFSLAPGSDPATQAHQAQHTVPYELGMRSSLAPFWSAKILQELTITVPASAWVATILPGLGLDGIRMTEVAMPRRHGFLPDDVIPFFETAPRQFDKRHYREAMQTCRDVRNAIERHLGASATHPIGTIVAQRLGWRAGMPQEGILNAMWAALREATNEAHHIAGGPGWSRPTRACLHFTAICIAYITQLVG